MKSTVEGVAFVAILRFVLVFGGVRLTSGFCCSNSQLTSRQRHCGSSSSSLYSKKISSILPASIRVDDVPFSDLNENEAEESLQSNHIQSIPRKIRMARSKSLTSSLASSDVVSINPGKRVRREPLLTKDEELDLANEIRTSRTFMRIKKELESSSLSNLEGPPSESEWANACGIPIDQLRNMIQQGKDARQKMVTANMGLVKSISKRYFNSLRILKNGRGALGTILAHNDLIQEGIIGLMEAIERFEPERKLRFSTYATWWVRKRITMAITENSRVIRLPAHVHDTLRKINKGRKELEKEMGRQPSTIDLAKYLGLTVEKLEMYLAVSQSTLSLEQPLKNSLKAEQSTATLGDIISSESPTPHEDAESRSMREEVISVVDELPSWERNVVMKRFGLDDGRIKTVDETSQQLGLAPNQVRMVETNALRNLRQPQLNYKLKSYINADDRAEEESQPEEGKDELTPEQIWSY